MSDATRILRILGLVFASIGLVMVLIAIGFGLRQSLATSGMVQTTGEVVAYAGRKAVVRFPTSTRQTVTIVSSTSSSPPAYDIGQQLRVYYDPNNPANAVIDTYLERWFVPTLFGGFAILFSLLGGGFLIFTALRYRRITWLRKNGMKVNGRIAQVQYNRYVQLDRKPTWQIVAEWSANGMNGRALSFHMMKDPTPLLGNRQDIDVWIDPKNPRNAWVDTDFLDPRNAVAQAVGPVQRRR